MKRTFKYFTLALLVVFVFIITGCNSDDPTSNFKNPKDLSITKNKTEVSITYDDDGTYRVNKVNKSDKVLISSKKEFRIELMYGTQNVKQQKKYKKYAANDKNYNVIDNVEYGKYKGYVSISRKYATADLFLYLDKNTVTNIRISTTKSSKVEKALKTKEAQDVLYNRQEIQDILNTIKYKKVK